jgi:hypothetical protein
LLKGRVWREVKRGEFSDAVQKDNSKKSALPEYVPSQYFRQRKITVEYRTPLQVEELAGMAQIDCELSPQSGKRVGTTLIVCADDDCAPYTTHEQRQNNLQSSPSLAPAPEAETQEEAEERQRNYEQQRNEYEQVQEQVDRESLLIPKWRLSMFLLSTLAAMRLRIPEALGPRGRSCDSTFRKNRRRHSSVSGMRAPSSRLTKGKRFSSGSIAAPVQIAGHRVQVSVCRQSSA